MPSNKEWRRVKLYNNTEKVGHVRFRNDTAGFTNCRRDQLVKPIDNWWTQKHNLTVTLTNNFLALSHDGYMLKLWKFEVVNKINEQNVTCDERWSEENIQRVAFNGFLNDTDKWVYTSWVNTLMGKFYR